jgi:predicted AlkP superfamily phosphohydrolase/phosphomutase
LLVKMKLPGDRTNPNKILIVGFDGLDPEFLERHLSELPVLNDLVKNGASGRLRSTIPPFSLIAWPAAMSGMNPARTGVTGLPLDDFAYSFSPLNSRMVKVPRLWDVASANGRKVGVVNVPLTYPPSPVNGFMISGFLTPSPRSDFAYPRTLKEELPPGYRTSLDFLHYRVKADYFLEHLYRLTEKQFQAVENLLRKKPWDLFVYVISGIDWIQHYFGRDPELPSWLESEEIIVKYVRYADDFLGRLRDRVDRSTTIIVLSDHGFGKVPSRYVYLNAWLEREGFLTFRRSATGSLKSALASHIRSLAVIPPLGFLKEHLSPRLRESFQHLTWVQREQIDWPRTRAYFSLFMHHTGYIRIAAGVNSPAERESSVREIMSGLRQLNDSRPGDKIFDRIYRREEIFSGGDLSGIPEIFLIFAPKWLGQAVPSTKLFREIPLGGRSKATHRMDGIFIFSGPSVVPGTRTDLKIYDIAPTVYGLLAVPIPITIDGRLARECFQPTGVFPELSPRRHYTRPVDGADEWSEDRQKEALEKLRALGYL